MQSQTALRSMAINPVEIFFAALGRVGELAFDPGVVESAVEPAVSLEGLVDHHLDLPRNRNVGGQTARFAAAFLDHLDRVFRAFRHVVNDHDLRAFFCQPERRRPSDS